jgi:hypothetical protein
VTDTQFQNLKYGNIIQDPIGRFLMVLHTNRDSQENVTAIGVVECFQATGASTLTLIDSTPHETVLLAPDAAATVIGILKTVPEKLI